MKGFVTIKVSSYAKQKIVATWKDVLEWKYKPKEQQVVIGTKYWLHCIPAITQIEDVLIPEHIKPYFKIYYYDSEHYGAYQDFVGDKLQALYDLVYFSDEVVLDDGLARFYRTFVDGVLTREF